MLKMKMKTREKIFKGVSLFSGLILIINMSAAGVFFIPSSVNANEVDIDTCANNAGDNSGGECPSPDWDKSSLVFDNGYACQGDCHEIAAKVCNLGDEDMDGTSSYEVWFNASGNPKDGAEAAGGEISALKVGECQVLTYLPSQNGNYKFRAMQRPGHSGQGDLWSESCENINIDECQGIDCGNNIKEDGEECDEGQDNGQVCVPSYNSSCKYCSDECQIIELTDGYCGNSIIENDEQCDGPAGVGQHQICNQDCDLLNLTYCGDGAKQTPNAEGTGGPANDGNEACDGADGTGQNQICSPECILINIEFCGDGINNDNEECDANGQNGQVCAPPYGGSCDYCSGVCQNVHLTGPYCGDGIKNGTEQCDGADGTPLHYTCTQACVLEYVPYCGDGIKNGTEECDDGNQIDSDECKNNCTLPTVCANDLDVMIVFDRSGSMGYDIPTRISQAKTAANTFLDKLRTGDQSGLVSYSTTATLNKTLSNSHSATKTAINSLIASGATNIGDAINLATGENISVRANPQAIKIQILLTDGKANKPYGPGNGEWPADVAYAKAKADEAAINGIKIFTIGLGSDVNASMLQYIASTTGGQYYFAPTGVDLQNIFNQIAYRACQFGSISGCKYNDINNDGNISGEPKLSGWKINLSGGVNLSQSTDQSGCYTFAGLSAGNYTVAEDPIQPYNFIQTYPANPNNYLIALADGQNTANKDFGNYIVECGNGQLDQGEECDGTVGVGSHQSCDSDCTLNNLTYCGDGAKQTPNDEGTGGPANDGNESCDGQSGVPANYTCAQNCVLEYVPYCGDGLINDSEECDDGNTANGDGCSSICANEPAPAPITIVINEIMKDPAAVSDTNGEWFEVYNTSTSSVDLLGCIIKDNGTNTHTISSSLVVPPLGYAVLARNASSTLNGGFNPDYAYSNFQLGNDSDEIILTCDNAIIDMVAYDNGATFPDPTGKSMILNNPANDNNIGGNWCVSSSSYGNGDLGTPGQANDSCGGEPLLNSIKVCKYSDLDSNTETTADQTPIGNWGFSLYNGQATTTQATAGDGCITFTSLADGSYTITEENKSGWIMLDPANGQQVVNVSGGQNSVLNFYNMELPPEPYCGDDIVSGGEACDGSAGVPAHYVCTNQCALEYLPYCGDGVVSGAEECDGQAGIGTGQICTANCLVETSFMISGGPLFITNTAHGFLPEPEPIVLGEEGAPQILISKIVNKDKVNPGDEIKYTVEVKNIGNLTAFNVILSDILPDGFIFADSNKTSMNWQLGDITAGNSINTSYKVLIGDKVADGIYANLAQASADNNKNVTDSVNVKVGKPQVLGAELAGTGFNNYELAGIIILIVLLFLMSSLLKRKYNN